MFVVMTADQLFKFVARDPAEMSEWVRLLTPKKRTGAVVNDEGRRKARTVTVVSLNLCLQKGHIRIIISV